MAPGAPLTILAIIPARGGSKRLPRKNLLPVLGVPLVTYSIRHALASRRIDEVIVSTDHRDIAAVAEREGATVVQRPAELSNDEAPSESALLHALDVRRRAGLKDPDLVVFLQCTSPIRDAGDIDAAIATLEAENADSLLSVSETKRFIWEVTPDGPRSLNYDFHRRRREQDSPPQYQENGSIYVFKPSLLRAEGNRLGGRIAVYEMNYWSSVQIDTPEDLELCEWILGRQSALPRQTSVAAWPADLRLVVFDFDGVMTDGRVIVREDGRESVVCSRRDGMGIERLRHTGVSILVLSKEKNPVVEARCRKLQVPLVQGIDDKATFLQRYLKERAIPAASVAYVGDDVNDVECLRMVGLPVAVSDAHADARAAATLVLRESGGHGAVREFCDLAVKYMAAKREEPDVAAH